MVVEETIDTAEWGEKGDVTEGLLTPILKTGR